MKSLFRLKLSPHELLPEDILGDQNTLRYPLELPVTVERLRVFSYILVGSLLLTGLVTSRLMLLEKERFSLAAARNATRQEVIEASRGAILDRNGAVLAYDQAHFRAILPADMIPEDPHERAETLAKIERKLGLEPGALSAIALDSNGSDAVLKDNLSPEEALLFEVRGAQDLGVRFEQKFRRRVADPLAFPHLLGYVGSPAARDLSQNEDDPPSRVGKDGIERAYDELLRGTAGFVGTRRDTDELIRKEPVTGSTLVLTIDASLQEFLFSRMREHLTALGLRRGAAVAQDPRSGAILALVSFPPLDAGALNTGLTSAQARELVEHRDFPFLSRVVSGEYPPGSVIKPFMALAALEEGIIKPETKILSTGQIEIPNPFRPGEASVFHDWAAHGWVDMRRALAVSSNVYFYTIGGGYEERKGLGIERISKYLRLFGLGERLGVDLPTEASGLVSGPQWKRTHRPRDPIWRIGDTYNVSIGQGDFTVTPLQVSAAISVIANGGKLWRPSVVSKIEDADGKVTSEFPPQLIRELPFREENLTVVREGMRMMVTHGMATMLNDLPVPVAGKTGTPQVARGETTHAWFSGFAPYENPEIVLTVLIEGERGGSLRTLPLVKEVFYWYFTQGKVQS